MEWRRAAQPFHEPEPVEAWHLEVAEDERGLDFGEQVKCLFAIPGDVRLIQTFGVRDALSSGFVVVHYQDPDIR